VRKFPINTHGGLLGFGACGDVCELESCLIIVVVVVVVVVPTEK